MKFFNKIKQDKFNTQVIALIKKVMPSRVFVFEPLNTSKKETYSHCLVFSLNPSAYQLEYDLSGVDATIKKLSTGDEDMIMTAIVPVLEQLKKDCIQAQVDIEATIDEIQSEYST